MLKIYNGSGKGVGTEMQSIMDNRTSSKEKVERRYDID
jgi:hypothetical protein